MTLGQDSEHENENEVGGKIVLGDSRFSLISAGLALSDCGLLAPAPTGWFFPMLDAFRRAVWLKFQGAEPKAIWPYGPYPVF